jgi:Ca2+-binding EF-hand superfamily protein
MYTVYIIATFIVWLIGTLMVQLAAPFCSSTSPDLYSYALFSVVTFWLGFILGALYIIKEIFGSSIGAIVKDTIRETNVGDAAESIFKAKYQKYDPKIKEGRIEKKDFPSLLKELGVFIPGEEQASLMSTFDMDDTGYLPYVKMLTWFKELNESIDDDELDDSDDDAPVDKEVAAIEKAERAKRAAAKAKKLAAEKS